VSRGLGVRYAEAIEEIAGAEAVTGARSPAGSA
jgi:hypothetical protein